MDKGRVVARHNTSRSYIVETEEGRVYRRNKHHIRKRFSEYKRKTVCIPNSEGSSRHIIGPTSSTASDHDRHGETLNRNYVTRSGRTVRKPAKFQDYVINSINY